MKLIYLPCRNGAEAKKIATTLLNKKLIACANYFPIKSVYRWKGKLQNGTEALLLLKTTKPFHRIKDEVERLHSDDVPCIAEIQTRNLNTTYHQWVLGELK